MCGLNWEYEKIPPREQPVSCENQQAKMRYFPYGPLVWSYNKRCYFSLWIYHHRFKFSRFLYARHDFLKSLNIHFMLVQESQKPGGRSWGRQRHDLRTEALMQVLRTSWVTLGDGKTLSESTLRKKNNRRPVVSSFKSTALALTYVNIAAAVR